MGNNNLLMPFIGDNDNPVFVNGFECGMIWEQINNKKDIIGQPFHSDNIEQMHLICDYYNVEYYISPVDEEWSTLSVIY